jgi:single-strand DNA-binding protein
MAQRFLNKVMLIGNCVKDPVIKQLTSGDPLCSFSIATNRYWKTDSGEKEDVQFHKIIAWAKLAEICGQLIKKGKKVYVEGRLSARRFKDSTGVDREITEIVLEDMILLDSRPKEESVETKAAADDAGDRPF